MSWKEENFREAVELISGVPDGTFFDIKSNKELQFQASTQHGAKAIRAAFPGSTWKKEWRRESEWWEYTAEYHGWKLQIYAIREAPRTCTAITERRKVKVMAPIAFEEREEEKEVIVGWNCDGEKPQATESESF